MAIHENGPEEASDNQTGPPQGLEGVPQDVHGQSIMPPLAATFGVMAMLSALAVCLNPYAGVGSLMFGIAAIYCGRRVTRLAQSGWEEGRGTATFGIVCGSVALFLFFLQMLLFLFALIFGPLFAGAAQSASNGGG